MLLRAHEKLFLTYTLLVGAVVVALIVGAEAALRGPLLQQATDELRRELALGREIFDGEPQADPDAMARRLGALTGHRVTVIATDGRVLGESGVAPGEVVELENHLQRPEVQGALADGTGVAVRTSVSVDRDLLYAATLTDTGPVLRFAVSITEIDDAVAGMRRQILQVGAGALVLAAILSLGFSFAVTRPLRRMRAIAATMADGDLGVRIRTSRRDELGELGDALDSLADELQHRLLQLEDEREEMRALIDSMAEGVLAIGPDATLRRANPAARAMFELAEAPEGAPPMAIARRKAFLSLVERVLEGNEIPPTELTHDGRHLLATARPLPRGGAVLVFLDTSELRRLEGVRRDFVANASHELKTPLTVIRGHAETLQDEDLPDELRRRFTETLRANAERLQAILDDLLDLSRIESGGWRPSPESIEVEGVVRSAWEPFSDDAQRRAIRFDVEITPGAERVEADAGALLQVFSNLLSNAVRYTPDEGAVAVTATPVGEDALEFAVRDTGSGIASAHLPRLFERFYRVDPARSRAEGGTGLGLAIVRHLVERHGGRVHAESELGRGTTIRFTLPLTQPALEEKGDTPAR